jgi:hypothetical protein
LKAGQSQLADFERQPKANLSILKAGQNQLADFESRQEPILPVFKSFSR